MPYPSISFRTELDPVVRKELDALSVQHEEYLSKEHKPDGTHGDLTADSAVIAGDLTVGGSVGFEDLSGNVITATTITCDVLNVGTTSNILGDEIVTGDLRSPITISNPRWALYSSGFGGSGAIEIYNDGLGRAAFRASDSGVLVGDSAGTPLAVGFDVFGDVTFSNDFAINTNKFTVNGATGNTAIANGAAYYWATRAVLTSPADGIVQLSNNAASAGARLDASSADAIAIRNLAGSDRGDFACRDVNMSGSVLSAANLPTSAGAAGTLWVDTAGGLNIVKRA